MQELTFWRLFSSFQMGIMCKFPNPHSLRYQLLVFKFIDKLESLCFPVLPHLVTQLPIDQFYLFVCFIG